MTDPPCGIPYLHCAGIGLADIAFCVAVFAFLVWITMRRR